MAVYWQLGHEYRELTKEVEELNDEILHRRERLRAPRITALNRTRGGNAPDQLGDGVAAMADFENLLKERIRCLNDKRAQAELVLETLPIRERRLLRLRYFHDCSWQQIAMKLHYDESTCRRIHRQLLRTTLKDQ